MVSSLVKQRTREPDTMATTAEEQDMEAAPSLAPELFAVLAPDETAAAYLRRSAPSPVRTGLWFSPSLRPGQALELVGPSGSGKTAVLVQAAADALARGEPVLMIDADATFDVSRLAAVLRARLSSAPGNEGDADGDADAVDAALSRFGLLTCHSALGLLSALVTLRASIESLGDGGNNKVRLVLLDNAAAFYWPLRASASSAARNARRRQLQQPASAPDPQKHLTLATMASASAEALRRALKGSGAAAIVTRHAVFPPMAAAAMAADKAGGASTATTLAARNEFFPQSWLSLASRRADLTPAGFSPGSQGGGRVERVRLTWRTAGVASRQTASTATAATLFFDLTNSGLLPSSF